jgi:hypothetical protein
MKLTEKVKILKTFFKILSILKSTHCDAQSTISGVGGGGGGLKRQDEGERKHFFLFHHFLEKNIQSYGASTFSIATLTTMTYSITSLIIMNLRIMAIGIAMLSMMDLF